MSKTMRAVPFKRVSRFSAAYSLYLAIVFLFDYVYYPWLAIKFKYLLILPLYPSIFLASWGGYYLYEYFQEDVFFVGKIKAWLTRPNPEGPWNRLQKAVLSRPSGVFAAVSAWWSPLHAYVFFQQGKDFELVSFLKSLAKGSLYCTLFWGVVAELVIFLWGLVKGVLA